MNLASELVEINHGDPIDLAKVTGLVNPYVSYRIRHVYFAIDTDDRPVYIVYARNGGGNRECCYKYQISQNFDHYDSSDNESSDTELSDNETSNNETSDNDSSDTDSSDTELSDTDLPDNNLPEYKCSWMCSCDGCVITYAEDKFPTFLRDEDDETDDTFAWMYFKILLLYEHDVRMFIESKLRTKDHNDNDDEDNEDDDDDDHDNHDNHDNC
jgi:hypothetical protein